MLKNYLKIALRNLVKKRTYSIINVFGLSIGVACSILLFLFVRNERSYDTFHQKKERIYRVYNGRQTSTGDLRLNPYFPMPFAPTLQTEYPEIESTVRFQSRLTTVRTHDNLVREQVLFTDPAFFEMFSFPLLSGSRGSSLLTDNAVVLSEATARKYFEDEEPLGEVISLSLGEQSLDFVVTGVVKNAPENSSIKYDFLAPFERLSELSSGARQRATSWGSHNTNVYLLLKSGADSAVLEPKLADFVTKYYSQPRELYLQRLVDVHLNPAISAGYLEPVSDPRYSYILAGIAAMVLLIACINFMTLATGQSTGRAHEVGTRKVLGARRPQLMAQFWGEALVMSFLAVMVGVMLAELFLPIFNDLTQKKLSLELFSEPTTLTMLAGLTLVVGLVAGSYPALLISGFQPVNIFRKRIRPGGSAIFGRVMVVLQFSLSIFLISTTIVMDRQQNYLLTKNLGFDMEQILVIPTIRNADGAQLMQRLKTELTSESHVVGVSGTGFSFNRGLDRVGFQYEGQMMRAYSYRVDYDYLRLLELQLLAGRDFSRKYGTDADQAVIVNETFARRYGWENPLGETFAFRGRNLTVIGVVKDYNFQSLHSAIEPAILHLDARTPIRHILIKMQAQDLAGSIELVKEKWNTLAENVPFEYSFLDNDVTRQYEAEERWDRIVTYSSMFAIVIASLGLFGLSALSVTRRTKEIGIRKVLGASVPRLVSLINKEFLTLVILGSIIAWPSAHFVMREWLSGFAYRVELHWSFFIAAAIFGLLIALCTVSYQSIKAAMADPADSLRYE